MFSGRRVIDLSLFSKVYISLFTISVVSPTPREKSSVTSIIGVLISLKPYLEKTSSAFCSMKCHISIFCGKMSFVPFKTFKILAIIELYNLKAQSQTY